jgi:two-component system OmpR family response regulator
MQETHYEGKSAAAERCTPIELQIGALTIDCRHFIARVAGHPVPLTRLEFDLLRYLVAHSDRVVSNAELLDCIVGGVHQPGSSLLRVHICHLRRKLGSARNSVKTVRGRGFWFDGRFANPV